MSLRAGPAGCLGDMGKRLGDLGKTPLEDEVSYGREGKVWAVAEDGVASTGKTHQAGGLRRQPAG